MLLRKVITNGNLVYVLFTIVYVLHHQIESQHNNSFIITSLNIIVMLFFMQP